MAAPRRPSRSIAGGVDGRALGGGVAGGVDGR